MNNFRIDVLDANDNVVGDGPLTAVEQVRVRRSLDRVGGADIVLMATDRKTSVVGAGRKYRVVHSRYGTLGTFLHASQERAAGSDQPKLNLKTYDQLIELARKNVYFRRNFDDAAVDSVVSTLIGLASGWSAGEIETGIGNTTVSYEGESVFEALDMMRDRWGRHFRLNGTQALDFGSFGDDSGLRLIRPESVPREMEHNNDAAFVTSLEILEEAEAVINRLIPVGAGAGTTQLTLEHVTGEDASYPVQSGLNADGSSYYYIEDTTSQGLYGTIERVFERPDIRPLTNATVNLENAANALYRAALSALLRWKDVRTTYQVSATKLDPSLLKPGDQVRLFYRGIAQRDGLPYKWVDVDEDLWVLDIEEAYDSSGRQAARLTVATSSDRRTADQDILAGLMRDTKVWKTHVQPNLTHSPVGPYVKRIDMNNTATFNVRLKEEVLAVNRVIVRFITNPLRASVSASSAASGGSSTPTTSSGGSSTPTTSSGGGTTPTTSSGGGTTPTTSSGGSSTPTTSSGGGSTPTTTSTQHQHTSQIVGAGGGDPVNVDSNVLRAASGPYTISTSTSGGHTHDVTIPNHDHTVNIASHQHTVTIAAHDHTVTIPNHDHTVNIAAHDHTVTIGTHVHTITLTYGIHEDSEYPRDINVSINGTDRTGELGGPWGVSVPFPSEPVDVEVDVTEYISRGQDNTVVFSCTNQGEITFLADCLLTIQAIVVT